MTINPLERFRFVGAVEDDTQPESTKSNSGLANELQTLLCDVATFYHFVHESHWNVNGPDFYQYHKFFDEIVSDTYESIDPIAENIRKLGGKPAYRMTELVKGSNLKVPNDSEDFAINLAKNIANLNKQIIDELVETFDTANKENEQGVANFIAERIDMHQKWQWFLNSSIGA